MAQYKFNTPIICNLFMWKKNCQCLTLVFRANNVKKKATAILATKSKYETVKTTKYYHTLSYNRLVKS